MQISEIASAEEQMALWKLISTSVWSAMEQQVQQQQRERAAQAKRASVKGRRGKNKAAASTAVVQLPAPPRPAPNVQPAKAATQQAAVDAAPAVDKAATAKQPISKFATRTAVDQAADAADEVDTVRRMSNKLR